MALYGNRLRRDLASALLVGAFAVTVTACREAAVWPDPRSEPPQIFYDPKPLNAKRTGPAVARLDRSPARVIETSLRPMPLRMAVPTPYAFDVTHYYQPWAREIWDYGRFGFSLSSLRPAQLTSFGLATGLPRSADGVIVEVGGYGGRDLAGPDVSARMWKTKVVEVQDGDRLVVEGGAQVHYLSMKGIRNLDGQPIRVTCYLGYLHECRADLSITADQMPPSLRSQLRSEFLRPDASGTRLQLTFNADLLSRWPEVYQKGMCFVVATLPDLSDLRYPARDDVVCRQVRKAIQHEFAQDPTTRS